MPKHFNRMMCGRRKWIRILMMITSFMTLTFLFTQSINMNALRHNGACGPSQRNAQGPLGARAVSGMTDWSFIKIDMCPHFSLRDIPKERKKIILKCNEESAKMAWRKANSSSDIFTIPFKDKCLTNFIDTCCLEGRTVPNVVHYVWYSNITMDFFHFLSFASVARFVKPCLILIHGQYVPTGVYWDYFVHVFPYIIHVQRDLPTYVGNNKLAFREHGSDVMRIQALDVYGGLYLDWDEVVLRPIDALRDYPMTMGIEVVNKHTEQMGSQFVMAKKGAPFLHLWLNSYETNYRDTWIYNALEVPFQLAKQLPDIIHIEGNRFTRPNGWQYYLLFDQNFNWADNYAMHLYSRHFKEKYKNTNSWYRFNEYGVGLLNITIGSVARHILYGNKELCVANKL